MSQFDLVKTTSLWWFMPHFFNHLIHFNLQACINLASMHHRLKYLRDLINDNDSSVPVKPLTESYLNIQICVSAAAFSLVYFGA